jgi:hypothetical protein
MGHNLENNFFKIDPLQSKTCENKKDAKLNLKQALAPKI